MSAEVAGVFEIVPELAFRNVAVRQCLLVSVMGRIMEEIVGTVWMLWSGLFCVGGKGKAGILFSVSVLLMRGSDHLIKV